MTRFRVTKNATGESKEMEAVSPEAALASLIAHLFTVEEVSENSGQLPSLFGAGLPVIVDEMPLYEFVENGWHRLKATFPGVADIQALTDKRKKAMGARAKEIAKAVKDPKWQNPKVVWERIFHEISKSLFLTGRAPPGRGRTAPFKLTIDYVVRPSEFAKIFEGAYDDTTGRNIERTHDEHTGREIGPAERAARAYVENNRSRFVPSR